MLGSLPRDEENELRDILRNLDSYLNHFAICHFGFSPFLEKLLMEKLSFTIIHSFKQQKNLYPLLCRI